MALDGVEKGVDGGGADAEGSRVTTRVSPWPIPKVEIGSSSVNAYVLVPKTERLAELKTLFSVALPVRKRFGRESDFN
jgi:hypothetical protein